MALSDDVVNNSIQGIQQGGPSKTVGDAISAYQAGTQLQDQQQKLQQDKDKNEMDKANWFISSVNNVAKIGGNAQKLAIDSLQKHVQQMYPGYNQDIMKMIKDDETVRQNLFQTVAPIASRGGISNPTDAAKVGQFLQMSGTDAPMYLEKMGQQQAEVQKSALMAQAAKEKQGTQINSRELQGAQRQWNAEFGETKPITQRIEGANRILNLMDAADRGEFKTNKAFLGQLNTEITKLENGQNTVGLNQQEKTEMESSLANFKATMDKWGNNISGVNLKKQMQQARGLIGDLRDSYLQMGDNKAEELKAGASDNQLAVFNAKHDSFRSHYGARGTGAPVAAGAPGAAGPVSAEATGPHGPAIKQNGVVMRWNGKEYAP